MSRLTFSLSSMLLFSETTEIILVHYFSELHFEFLYSADHDFIKLKIDFIVFNNNSFFFNDFQST
jgi:hypothetical protein